MIPDKIETEMRMRIEEEVPERARILQRGSERHDRRGEQVIGNCGLDDINKCQALTKLTWGEIRM